VADLLIRLGNCKKALAEYSSAARLYEEALAINTTLHGESSPEVSSALNNLGSVLMDQGRLNEAMEYFHRALEIDQRVLGPEDPAVANRLLLQGDSVDGGLQALFEDRLQVYLAGTEGASPIWHQAGGSG
jgi:tetratricopeptide (TPR) repeat protein